MKLTPCHQSPHVATNILNVATGKISQNFIYSNIPKIQIATVFFLPFLKDRNVFKGLILVVVEQNIFKILSHFRVNRVISTCFEKYGNNQASVATFVANLFFFKLDIAV